MFLSVRMLSSEFHFLVVFTAELAPFSISYLPSYARATQSAYAGTVWVAVSLGATQLMWGSAGLNSHVSRLWSPSLVLLSCESSWTWFGVWSTFMCSFPICNSFGKNLFLLLGELWERLWEISNTVLSWLPQSYPKPSCCRTSTAPTVHRSRTWPGHTWAGRRFLADKT